jgi:hypothetical protein
VFSLLALADCHGVGQGRGLRAEGAPEAGHGYGPHLRFLHARGKRDIGVDDLLVEFLCAVMFV